MRPSIFALAALCGTLLFAQRTPPPSQGLTIFDVALSAVSFNPMRGEKVQLRYSLSRQARVTVKAFDPDRQLVRALASNALRKRGPNQEAWDGKDLDGRLVPNEAYFFTIEAEDASRARAVYDPITFSGGEPGDVTRGRLSRDAGTLGYQLSRPSRVLVRAGIPGNALLKTIADWQPRAAGQITEYWNGKDEDGLINVADHKNYKVIIAYVTLPDATVITIGNDRYDYRAYKSGLKAPRPQKEERPMANRRKLSPHFLRSRLIDRDFKVQLSFPEDDKPGALAVPAVKDRILTRVDVAPRERAILQNQQFEIMLFVDTGFHAEEERGYLPFNYPWEVKQLPAGEHVFTVNIIAFGNQIGLASRKIRVLK